MDEGSDQGGGVLSWGVGWEGGGEGEFVGQEGGFEVCLEDCHADVEGGDFVGEALWEGGRG